MKKVYFIILNLLCICLVGCGVSKTDSNTTFNPTVTYPTPTIDNETKPKPTPEPTEEVFTIKFLNYDGTVLYQTKALAGQLVLYLGDKPTRPSEVINGVRYYYEFDHWDGEAVCKGNAVRHAIFKSSREKPMNKDSKNEIASFLLSHGKGKYNLVNIGSDMDLGYDSVYDDFVMDYFISSEGVLAETTIIAEYGKSQVSMGYIAQQNGVVLLDVLYKMTIKNHSVVDKLDIVKVNTCIIKDDLLKTIMNINAIQTTKLISATNEFLKSKGFSYIF